MGKFAPSYLHDWFSKWHWQKCSHTSYLTDVDRIWIEIRNSEVIAIFELKYPFDEGTYTEDVLTQFFENQNRIPFYKIYVRPYTYKGPVFHVFRPTKKLMATLSEKQMATWIDEGLKETVFLTISKQLPNEIRFLHEILE